MPHGEEEGELRVHGREDALDYACGAQVAVKCNGSRDGSWVCRRSICMYNQRKTKQEKKILFVCLFCCFGYES